MLHIPFGYLFLPHPPEESLPILDLRTVGDHQPHEISPDLRDLLNDVTLKQDWYRDCLIEQGAEPVPFVRRFGLQTPTNDIATDITRVLDLTLEHRTQARNGEEFLRLLMNKTEDVGVMVMRSGIVGSNTHRALDVHEFRGFAIADDYAPVVFLNGRDARAAQIFTLVHELAHLWLGVSGISDLFLDIESRHVYVKAERVCNAVAAEVLAPEKAFLVHWNTSRALGENADDLARLFRVSTVVIARRAVDLGVAAWDEYHAFYTEQAQQWRNAKKSDGGSPYKTIPVRNGRRFTDAVVRAALEQRLLLRDAGRMLGLQPSNIGKLAREMGVV